jgi:hypothetical protein
MCCDMLFLKSLRYCLQEFHRDNLVGQWTASTVLPCIRLKKLSKPKYTLGIINDLSEIRTLYYYNISLGISTAS